MTRRTRDSREKRKTSSVHGGVRAPLERAAACVCVCRRELGTRREQRGRQSSGGGGSNGRPCA